MSVLYTNNASTTLATGITSGSTSISVASGTGSLFPAISGSDFFYVTLANTAGTVEIVKVTARSTDTLTVVRGQEGTTAVTWSAGDKVELRITKAMLDQLKVDAVSGYATAANLSAHTGNTSNPHSVTAAQVGLGNVTNESKATMFTSPTFTGNTSGLGVATGTSFNSITGLSSTTPSMNGSAAVGTSTTAARADHVHASDTAKVTANSAITAGTNTKITYDAKGLVTSGTTLSASDIPSLDASKITSGTIDAARLPSYVDDVIEGATTASFPTTGETGKIYVALDTNKAYRWSGSAYVYITSGAVDSVAGRTGVVTLTKSDVGLSNVDNTSDASKPVSTATQTALNLKANLASPTFTGTVSGITKTMVGLGSVDNTADSAKNVLSATKLTTARTINGTSFDGTANITIADSTKQPLDADLTAIAGLTGTSGLLKKTAADTWSLDTSAYITGITSGMVTTALGYTPYNSTNPAGYTTNTGTVTGVTGTAPIVSSGGTAPAISISAATTSAAGSMSAADKTKLNGIATGATANTGTVTSVSGTGSYGGLTLSGTVTSSGNLTLGGTPTGTWPISVSGNAATASNGGVTSVNGLTGAVTLSTGGVTSLNGQTGAIVNTNIDAIGSIVMAAYAVRLGTPYGDSEAFYYLNAGTAVAGSNLRYNPSVTFSPTFNYLDLYWSGESYSGWPNYGGGGTSLSGTWRCLGRLVQYVLFSTEGYYYWYTTGCYFVRVS